MCTECREVEGDEFYYSFRQPITFMDYSNKLGKFVCTDPIIGSNFQPENIMIDVPFGLELETEYEDEDNADEMQYQGTEAIEALHRDMPCQVGSNYQPIIRKEDGSLYNGTEFVTQPMTLRAHRQVNYNSIRDFGLKGYYPDSTGLHIHLPKSYFSHRQLLIFLMLHRDLALDSSLLDFIAKRGPSRWAKREWQYHLPMQRSIKGGRITQLAWHRHGDENSGVQRYSFVNLVPAPTIELRYFKSNLEQSSLMARLEYVDAIYKFTKLLSLHPLQKVVDFSTNYGLVDLFVVFSYMFENKYPLLTSRLHNNDWSQDKVSTKSSQTYADMMFDASAKLYLPTSKGGK
jgi:hypothetical protein